MWVRIPPGSHFLSVMRNISFSIVLLFVLSASFCERPETYSEIPSIKFKEFILKDTIDALDNPIKKGTLVFTFIDGDGDIGLMPQDTTYPFDSTHYYNLFLDGYYYENGVVVADSPSVPLYYRVPYIEPQGQNKVLKGTIKVDIIYNFPIVHDSIFYKFYILDRKFHKSNVEQTPVIVLND